MKSLNEILKLPNYIFNVVHHYKSMDQFSIKNAPFQKIKNETLYILSQSIISHYAYAQV